MRITVRERAAQAEGFDAEVAFDNDPPYAIQVRSPFDAEQEKRLRWYFEGYLQTPHLLEVRAREAAQSVKEYGEKLFGMLFANPDAYAYYRQGLQTGATERRIEIIGSPEFHQLHWEALRDPQRPLPFAVEFPFVRTGQKPPQTRATVRPSPTLNVLVVTARPDGSEDVGYRTISRPLVEQLGKSNTPVQLDILRPGTYQALVEHLEETRGEEASGYYHIIHFDLHGALFSYDQIQQGVKMNRYLYQARYASAFTQELLCNGIE